MTEPDSGLENLRYSIKEFAGFVAARGHVSESDTRVKLIDRILTTVCGWLEEMMTREDHVESGFIDYALEVQTRRYVAVEAKRQDVAFTLPDTASKTLKL